MAEKIISRKCSVCKQIKLLSEFNKDKNRQYGRAYICKICTHKYQKKYRKTEKYKISQIRYKQSEKGKKAIKRGVQKWIKTEKGKQWWENYWKSEKGKFFRRENARKYRLMHPEQDKVHKTICKAIKEGKLQKPKNLRCYYCSNKAKEYHHHKGYSPEHWLDVVPVCKKCHNSLTLLG